MSLAIVNSVAMNTEVNVCFFFFFQLRFSQGICPVLGLLGHMAVFFLVF